VTDAASAATSAFDRLVSLPPEGDEPMSTQTEANGMKPVVALAILGLLAAALFGFGQLLGAWDVPASAEPATAPAPAREPTVPLEQRERKRSQKPEGRRHGEDDRRLGRKGLPASVVRRLNTLCRRARVDALTIAAQSRPTNKKRMRRFFEQLGELNEAYNSAALEAFGRYADHPRARALARLFARDEWLLDDLLAGIAALESPAGRARFERRLEELRRVGIREAQALAALGAHACDTTFMR
jgi:hypothetical protein